MRTVGFATVVCLLLLLGACSQTAPDRSSRIDADFRVGTQGVDVRFVNNLPPDRMYDDEDFDVLLEVENMGTAPIGFAGDKIYLSGFDPSIVTGVSVSGAQIPILDPRDQYTIRGGRSTVSMKGIVRDLRSMNTDKYTTTLLVTACIRYTTEATAMACVDPDPFSTASETKVCVPTSIGLSGGQGAPVAVSNVDVDARRGKTQFRIEIQDVGGGKTFKDSPLHINKCNPNDPTGLQYDEVDFVRLERVDVAGRDITATCRPLTDGLFVRLIDGTATISCDLTGLGSGSAYLSPLNVILRYGYRTELSKPVEILRSR